MLSPFSCVRLFATLWTLACQVPLSMGFSRQEYCSGLPCPPPLDLPDPGIEPESLCLPHWQTGSSPLAPLTQHACFIWGCPLSSGDRKLLTLKVLGSFSPKPCVLSVSSKCPLVSFVHWPLSFLRTFWKPLLLLSSLSILRNSDSVLQRFVD